MKPGDTYETLDHAACLECRRHWERDILCEAVDPGVYHRKLRTLSEWREGPAGSSYACWMGAKDGCPACVKREAKILEASAQGALFD